MLFGFQSQPANYVSLISCVSKKSAGYDLGKPRTGIPCLSGEKSGFILIGLNLVGGEKFSHLKRFYTLFSDQKFEISRLSPLRPKFKSLYFLRNKIWVNFSSVIKTIQLFYWFSLNWTLTKWGVWLPIEWVREGEKWAKFLNGKIKNFEFFGGVEKSGENLVGENCRHSALPTMSRGFIFSWSSYNCRRMH